MGTLGLSLPIITTKAVNHNPISNWLLRSTPVFIVRVGSTHHPGNSVWPFWDGE